MTPEDLRARLLAAMRVSYAEQQAERPDGITASMILGCHSYGARKLLSQPEQSSADVWRAHRGTALHEYLFDLLAGIDPGFVDGRTERFTWNPGRGLPEITGAFDFALDDVLVELKTAPKTECRFRADHGAEPQHAGQVSVAATALGYERAAVVYLPTDSGAEEIAVCPVDVAHWTKEAVSWLERVDVRDDITSRIVDGMSRQEATRRTLDEVPRDKPVSWCRLLCPYVSACRGDYTTPVDLEIPDPTMRTAAQEAEHWRQIRLDAGRREEAAKAMLRHVEGVVHDDGEGVLRVDKRPVAPSKGRRGYVATTVERRPE